MNIGLANPHACNGGHCWHETCKDENCKGNHILNGHTQQCIDPYTICCICDKKINKEDFKK